MDLKLKDVAELLRVPELRVQQWLDEGKIPAYRLANEVRFDRLELESWLIEQGLSENSDLDLSDPAAFEQGMLKYDLYRAIYRGDVYANLKGQTKDSIIRQTTDLLSTQCPVQSDSLHRMLMARERLMPTGLGQGIAVPHTRDFLLDTHFDVMCIVYPEKPLDYGSIDRMPVHTLFFLFACSDKTHLHLLAKIASFCQHKNNLRLLQAKPDKTKLLDAILSWEKQI